MNKTLIALAIVISAFVSVKADYLYWQVTDSQYSTAGSGNANMSSLYANYNGVNYYLASTQTMLGQYDLTKWAPSSDLMGVAPSAEGVTYYIELASYNSSLNTATATAHAGPFSYADLHITDNDLISAMRTTVQNTWSGANYTPGAVPEPTSGLMMLVGMALLGLKRRRA